MKPPTMHFDPLVAALLQEPVLASVTIQPKGAAGRQMVKGVTTGIGAGFANAGPVPDLIAEAIRGGAKLIGRSIAPHQAPKVAVPDHAYLCVTPSRLGIYAQKVGIFKPRLGELALLVPRSQVVGLAEHNGHVAWLATVLQLADGRQVAFEYHRAWRAYYERVRALIVQSLPSPVAG